MIEIDKAFQGEVFSSSETRAFQNIYKVYNLHPEDFSIFRDGNDEIDYAAYNDFLEEREEVLYASVHQKDNPLRDKIDSFQKVHAEKILYYRKLQEDLQKKGQWKVKSIQAQMNEKKRKRLHQLQELEAITYDRDEDLLELRTRLEKWVPTPQEERVQYYPTDILVMKAKLELADSIFRDKE